VPSDKAALAECLKYVSDFPGDVPGVNEAPKPATHIDNVIKLWPAAGFSDTRLS